MIRVGYENSGCESQLAPAQISVKLRTGVAFRDPITEPIVMAKNATPTKGKTHAQKVMTKSMPASKVKPSAKKPTPNTPVKK